MNQRELIGKTGKVVIRDCMEGMGEISNKEYTFCVSDPPYGENIAPNGKIGGDTKRNGRIIRTKQYEKVKWDNEGLTELQFKEIQRVSKYQALFGFNHYMGFLPATPCIIVWDKKKKNNWDDNFADCELAWTNFDRPAKVFHYLFMGAFKEKPEERFHPTQKPFEVIKWIVENFLEKGGSVIDPFMGSGTTAMVCEALGIEYIGFEINPIYADVIQTRINEGIRLNKNVYGKKVKGLRNYGNN